MRADRFARQIPFLTDAGQNRLERARVAIVGVGGLGSHVVQQLAYLGVVNFRLIDHDRIAATNLNRLVTATPEDVGRLKVDVLGRFVASVHPGAEVRRVPEELRSAAAFEAIKSATVVVGCVDDDGPRLLLTQLCAAYEKPYLDLSSELGKDQTSFGGKIVWSRPGEGCLMCRGFLDPREIQAWLETPEEQRTRNQIYGQRPAENGSAPSVVSLNGVVASLGVMELMLEVSGVRQAYGYRKYAGQYAVIVDPEDAPPNPKTCRICSEVRGQGDVADLERFIREKPNPHSTERI